MGMYTQVRGILCCDSIGVRARNTDFSDKLEKIKEVFKRNDDIDRKFVCDTTCVLSGHNDSKWIVIVAELKNYFDSMEKWIEFLVKNIDCEGRIEFQYEESRPERNSEDTVWLVRKGGNIEITTYQVHTEGYGF